MIISKFKYYDERKFKKEPPTDLIPQYWKIENLPKEWSALQLVFKQVEDYIQFKEESEGEYYFQPMIRLHNFLYRKLFPQFEI